MFPGKKGGGSFGGGGVAKWADFFFLFFTTIALYFDIVGVLGPSLSLPNKRTKCVNLNELLTPPSS